MYQGERSRRFIGDPATAVFDARQELFGNVITGVQPPGAFVFGLNKE